MGMGVVLTEKKKPQRHVKPGLETVGSRIALARLELGMSQRELADLVHVTERTIQAYELDDVEPYRKLRELSQVLDRPMNWILYGDKDLEETGNLKSVLQNILEELRAIRSQLKA